MWEYVDLGKMWEYVDPGKMWEYVDLCKTNPCIVHEHF